VTGEPAYDEVDRIVAAWGRERPDLDTAPMAVLSRVTRLARHLDLARRGAFARHGLTMWAFDVLSALRRAGAPYRLSPGALVTSTLVTSGTMTNRIDRLVGRGLVRRRPSPEDRRGVLVELTPAGLERVDAALADLLDSERHLLAALSDAQRAALAGLLKALVVPFEAPPDEPAEPAGARVDGSAAESAAPPDAPPDELAPATPPAPSSATPPALTPDALPDGL